MPKIIFVVHPDDDSDRSIFWGVCQTCGNMEPIPGAALGLPDEHNDPLLEQWETLHICKDNPDYFALVEYGDINEYYGLDLDAL